MPLKHFEIDSKSITNRLDVTYYLIREEVNNQLVVDKQIPLQQVCSYVRTKTPPREAYVEEGIPCIKLRNVNGRILNTTNCDFIPQRLKAQFITAKKFDIILTATGEGTAGRADMFMENNNYVVTGENILLRPDISRINPFYLLAILRTKIISKQLKHFVRGATGQTHLYWQDVANITIPFGDPITQKTCERIYLEALNKRRLAADKINSAKIVVRKAAGISHLDPKQQRNTVFETRFTKFKSSFRFDVEYYQPIHNQIRVILEKAGCIKASTIAKLNKTTVNPREFPSRIYNYLDISSVDTEISDYESTMLYGHEAPTRARRKPSMGDLLVSTVRPNRNAVAIIEEDLDCLVASTGFAVITPTLIKPHVLFAILKTEPIYYQIIRKATAAMYPAVTEEDVLDILIPQIPDSLADQIEQYIKQCITLRKESDDLLDEFKNHGENVYS